MKMNPGTRPARSSRFAPGPDADPDSNAAADAENDQVSASERLSVTGLATAPGNDCLPRPGDISARFSRSFPGHPEQVARARHFVTAALPGCQAAPDAVLLTSELATNAVWHSATGRGGAFAVAVWHAGGRIKVTVTDDGSATRPAVAAAAEQLATSGRGLLLVDALADSWGYEAGGPDGRGCVWFELSCPGP